MQEVKPGCLLAILNILSPSDAFTKESLIYYVSKFYREINISWPLTSAFTCAHQELRNVSFSENVEYVLNKWLQIHEFTPKEKSLKIYENFLNGKMSYSTKI